MKKCKHRSDDHMGYLQWHEDADRRMRLGQKQIKCKVCVLFIWRYLFRKPKKK